MRAQVAYITPILLLAIAVISFAMYKSGENYSTAKTDSLNELIVKLESKEIELSNEDMLAVLSYEASDKGKVDEIAIGYINGYFTLAKLSFFLAILSFSATCFFLSRPGKNA